MKFFFLSVLCFSSLLLAQEGVVKKYYPNGVIESEINYSKNIREGIAKYYYPSGKLKEEISYNNGRVEGSVKRFFENGKIKESYFIEDGKRSGAYSYAESDTTEAVSKSYSAGILFIPPKEEPLQKQGKTNNPVVIKQKKGLTFEEKIVATLNGNSKPALDTLPVDEKTGYYTRVPEMPVPIIGLDSLNKKLTYPESAREKKITGAVILYAYINESGDVTKTEIVKGLGYGLDDAAEIAVFYTRFKPGKIAGVPQKVRVMLSLEFKPEFK